MTMFATLFWVTGWAFALYIVVLIGLLVVVGWGSYLYFKATSKLRQDMEVEQKVNEIKLRFFTNISHELRTPLTLISGPVEHLLERTDLAPDVREQLEIVESNSNRMLRMVNQILDFRKIQNKKLRLKIQHTNIKQLISDTCLNFNKEAYDHHINFQVINDAPDTMLWVDRDKLDTIVFNLLSNAFKFTPSGKSITVHVSEKANPHGDVEWVLIRVSDTGCGIPMEKRNLLFQRFASNIEINKRNMSVSAGTNPGYKTGTGIGLNLVKELVDLHQGYIEVESEVGMGTTFTVMLRTGKEHFGMEVDMIVDDPSTSDVITNPSEAQAEMQERAINPDLSTILVVDDSEDMRRFLVATLSEHFNVLTAEDGRAALPMVQEKLPDLVVTDLMMPNMDGLELTSALKTDMQTSHIPVILLTAKSAIESRLAALEYGADDYLTKPFSPSYLRARIDNIIRERERLQALYRSNMAVVVPEEQKPKKPSPNEIFLQKITQYMENNMEKNDISVDDLVRETAMGRTVFFNKLKGITGLSPVEWIRDYRIRRAAQLLEVEEYNITEITYMVGLNDSRYFSKCFKQMFGMTPTEYRRKRIAEKANAEA